MTSEVVLMQSKIDLPLMNPLWFSEMILGAMLETLSAKILNWKLAKAIGRKFSPLSASGNFGIMITALEFNDGSTQPCLKN